MSPAMTPEGQHLVLHAMAMHSIDVPLGGPVLAIIRWRWAIPCCCGFPPKSSCRCVFTRPDEPICTDVPLGGGGFARALFNQETELLGVPSGSWCPIVPNRWSKTPAAISLYVLLGMLVVLGLGRFFVQDFGAWLHRHRSPYAGGARRPVACDPAPALCGLLPRPLPPASSGPPTGPSIRSRCSSPRSSSFMQVICRPCPACSR